MSDQKMMMKKVVVLWYCTSTTPLLAMYVQYHYLYYSHTIHGDGARTVNIICLLRFTTVYLINLKVSIHGTCVVNTQDSFPTDRRSIIITNDNPTTYTRLLLRNGILRAWWRHVRERKETVWCYLLFILHSLLWHSELRSSVLITGVPVGLIPSSNPTQPTSNPSNPTKL